MLKLPTRLTSMTLRNSLEIMRAVASGDPDSGRNTGAIDQDAGFAEGFGCFG
jgi:hypothetical protein